MKSRWLLIGLLIVALAGWAAYSHYVPGHAPPEQPPVANLDPSAFEQQFRAAASSTRILAFFSPT
jgi:hypothetical protein